MGLFTLPPQHWWQSTKPMKISEIPSPTQTLTRLEQLESVQYMITLNGAELSALAQLTRKVAGNPDATYRKYIQPLSNWYEKNEFLYTEERWFSSETIAAKHLPN